MFVLAGTLLAAPAGSASTPAGVVPTPADSSPDAAATVAFLRDGVALNRVLLRNAAASRTSAQTLMASLGRECAGVLAGAPDEEAGSPAEGPRAQGEWQRSELQMQTIGQELRATVIAAPYEPDRAAIEAYAASVSQLNWSDPRIAPLVRRDAEQSLERATPPVASVCADMRSWAQSGYHVLSSASRGYEAAQRERARESRPTGARDPLLKPYEGSLARRLRHEITTQLRAFEQSLNGLSESYQHLLHMLGEPETEGEKRQAEPVLGHGRTSAGARFVVRRERSSEPHSGCRNAVSVDMTETSRGRHGLVSSGSGVSVCLSSPRMRQPSVWCGGQVLSVAIVVPSSVSSVRMTLSNGASIASGVVRVAARDGGPAGVYVQATRGRKEQPTSLTELTRDGKVAKVVKVPRSRACFIEPPKGEPQGPKFVRVANGEAPNGQLFAIEATIFRFSRHGVNFSMSASNLSELAAGGESTLEHHAGSAELDGTRRQPPYERTLSLECPPHEFALVYGILKAPEDTVLARTATGLVELTKVPLAPDLHSGGPLVYGVFSTAPSELIVREPDGQTLYTESLAREAKEEAEFCEGYEER